MHRAVTRRGAIGLGAAAAGLGATPAHTLRVAVPALPGEIDPHRARTPFDRAVARELYPGLLAYDAAGAVGPGLAESWTESADGLTYNFVLRSDAVWSDGTPLTAQDVVFGFARALDPALDAPFALALLGIAGAAEVRAGGAARALSVTAAGRHAVTIRLATRDVHFLETLCEPVAAPVPRAAVQAAGREWIKAERLVTSGLAAVAAPDAFTLLRPPRGSWRAAAEVVQLQPVGTFERALDAVRAGQADLAWGFAPDLLERLPDSRATSIRPAPSQALLFVAANCTKAHLKIREVRHALGMTIDREGLIHALKLSNAPFVAVPSYDVVPPEARGTVSYGAPYEHIAASDRDVVGEVLLLEDDIDPGHPVHLALSYPAGRVSQAIAKTIAEGWTKRGVQVSLQERLPADHAAVLHSGAFDLALAVSTRTDTAPWPYLAMFAGAAGADNLSRYAEVDFDRHLAAAAATTDTTMALGELGAAAQMLAEDQAILPILAFHPIAAVGAAVTGWEANPRDLHPLRLLGLR